MVGLLWRETRRVVWCWPKGLAVSDQVVEGVPAVEGEGVDGGAVVDRLPEEHPLVKAYKAEKAKARENARAAAKLAELEAERMSAEEKAQKRLAEMESKAAALEAEVARKGVAIKYGLSAEDSALLAGVSGEEAMEALAKRLADGAKAASAVVPAAGGVPAAPGDDLRAFVSALGR